MTPHPSDSPVTPDDEDEPIVNLNDLLTPEEQERLFADLYEMARLRRQAEASACGWPMP